MSTPSSRSRPLGPPLITRIGTLSENEAATGSPCCDRPRRTSRIRAKLADAPRIAIGSETDSWPMGKCDDIEPLHRRNFKKEINDNHPVSRISEKHRPFLVGNQIVTQFHSLFHR